MAEEEEGLQAKEGREGHTVEPHTFAPIVICPGDSSAILVHLWITLRVSTSILGSIWRNIRHSAH